MTAISFPILEINPAQAYIGSALVEDAHTRCYQSALKSGYFDDLYVLDSMGILRKVQGAEKVGTVGSFGGITWSLQKWIRVKMNYDNGKKITLSESQEFLCSVIDRDPDHWESMTSIDEIKEMVRATKNHQELIELFSVTLK